MFGINKKTFTGLLISIVNASSHTKRISLNNKKCMTQPLLINLYPNEYHEELHYYPFVVKLNKSAESCNILNDLSSRVCLKI